MSKEIMQTDTVRHPSGSADISDSLLPVLKPPMCAGGKPLCIKRRPGRPRKDGASPTKTSKPILKVKRFTSGRFLATNCRGIRGRRKRDAVLLPYRSNSVSGVNELGQIGNESPSKAEDTAESDSSSVASSLERLHEDYVLFPEQWPGKVCAFCNLGERSLLGQGELLRLKIPTDFDPQKVSKSIAKLEKENLADHSIKTAASQRRLKGIGKMKRLTSQSSLESLNEPIEEFIGFAEEPDPNVLFDIASGFYYTHASCARWCKNGNQDTNGKFIDLEVQILRAACQRCSHCGNFGAGVECKKTPCGALLHFPCTATSGAYQDRSTFSNLCISHLDAVISNGMAHSCTVCNSTTSYSSMLMCCSCGHHYHHACMALNPDPIIRAGWQCPACKVCQACRQPGEENKLLSCDTCDKAYHVFCLRPALASIPKHSWKCKMCRVCSDCGARTPGSGPSSRWHANFSVCDSCYQQRNKGLACPLCGKAYRHVAQKLMIQCHVCKKFVHGSCDPNAELSVYQQKKQTCPDYDYTCLHCISGGSILPVVRGFLQLRKSSDMLELEPGSFLSGMSQHHEGSGCTEDEIVTAADLSSDLSNAIKKRIYMEGSGSAVCFTGKTIRKKSGAGRPRNSDLLSPGSRRPCFSDVGHKRGPKPKLRGNYGMSGAQRPSSESQEEEPGVENRLVLCSSKDDFVLQQDVCVMCGAFGNDSEGRLIACAQCGQCYHPFCVNVSVTKVVLQKGWRCLDCTVCEGCGQRHDEARLILCDDCDISFHIYCINPPLDYVPQGNWKCKWCTVCQMCGSSDPGINSFWQHNYSMCGPCTSLTSCPTCNTDYNDSDLIVHCAECDRWMHSSCDDITTEEDAEKCMELGYKCRSCRPRDALPPHLVPSPKPLLAESPPRSPDNLKMRISAQFTVDGVCLSDHGMHHVKARLIEQPRKKRKKMNNIADMEAGILAAIETVVSGSSLEVPDTIGNDRLGDTGEKDREGKKRQRNLQKVGIGGFLVRLRGSRFKDDEFESVPEMSGSTGDPEKPKKKSPRRKMKNKLIESFPVYLQEAFFGKILLEPIKICDIPTADDNDSDSVTPITHDNKLNLTKDQIIILDSMSSDIHHDTDVNASNKVSGCARSVTEYLDIKDIQLANIKIEDGSTEMQSPFASEGALNFPSRTEVGQPNLKLKQEPLPGTELGGDELGEIHPGLDIGSHKDDISNFLNSGFALESVGAGLPSMDSMDVEDVFKVVHADESQESQDTHFLYKDKQINSHTIQNYQSTLIPSTSNSPSLSSGNTTPMSTPAVQGSPGITRSASLPPNIQQGLTSPVNFPPPSPYHSEYSNSPQFSPAFSEPPSPWPTQVEPDVDPPSTYNQRSLLKWEADEVLGNSATISAVLYANMNHPELKRDYLTWNERSKQIAKIWRSLSAEKRAPYLQKARENRAASRMQKVQQDQDKLLTGPVKNVTRAETPEERHWKQMQVLRQQQAQQQQQMLQEHRVQGELKQELAGTPSPVPSPKHQYSPIQVQRQLSVEPNSGKEGSKQLLQVSTSLDQTLSPQMPSPVSHQYSKTRPPTLGIVGHRPVSQSSEMPPPNPSGLYSVRPNLASTSPLTSRPVLYSRLPFGTSTRPQMPSPTAVFSSNPAIGMEHFVRANSPIHRPQSDIEIYSPNSESFHAKPVDFVSGGVSGTGSDDDTMLLSSKNSGLQGNETRQHLRELLQRQQNKKRLDTDPLAPPVLQKPSHWSREDWQNSSMKDGASGDSYGRGLHAAITGSTSPSLQGTQQIPQQSRFRFLSPQIRTGVVTTPAPALIPSSGSQENANQDIVSGQPDPSQKDDSQKLFHPSVSAGHVNPFDSSEPAISTDTPVTSSMLAQQLVRPASVILNLHSRSSPSFPRKRAPVGVGNAGSNLTGIVAGSGGLNSSDHQELPESVTEELEKLEQEQHNDTEPETADLVDLGVDDDELLGMGADFNILEYADPELDQAVGGEKTNILDNLDLEEEKEDEKELTKHIKGKDGKDKDRNEPVRADSKPVVSPAAGNIREISKLDTESSVASSPSDKFKQSAIAPEISTVALLRPQPPPPYPGPPPPYPGRMPLIGNRSCNDKVSRLTNMSLVIPSSSNSDEIDSHLNIPSALPITTTSSTGSPMLSLHQRRTLLLQEQPLLLAELLEQEKREQQKQGPNFARRVGSPAEERLLSDFDFERLKADVLQSGGSTASVKGILPSTTQSLMFGPGTSGKPAPEHGTPEWSGDLDGSHKNPDPSHSEPAAVKRSLYSPSPIVGNDTASRFRNSVSLLPPPPQPPEYPVTEQERQMQVQYEQWLYHQQHILSLQLQFFDQEVTKLRKGKKSMKSKQRQLRKNSSELSESGTAELEKITRELTVLQKQLEQSRKQARQHGVIVQEYRTKQQKLQILGGHQTGAPIQVSLPSQVSPSGAATTVLVSPSASTPLLSPSNSVIGH